MKQNSEAPHLLSPQRAVVRFSFAILAGVGAALLTPSEIAWTLRVLLAWDVAAAALLLQSWALLLSADAEATERRAGTEDPGRNAVFMLAVMSCLFGLFASTLGLRLAGGHNGNEGWLALSLLSVALSWLLTHTMYTFRYAHLYYRGERNGGLTFPGTAHPDDLDFAYYAFTLGMCFQVSDVQITSRQIRRSSLAHALISFLFNTTILALALNLISRLLDG
jgi:uncharacterized membrane protein